MKITINIKFKKRIGTCPRTPKRNSQGQLGDTNNNDNNNIIFILFNKYISDFSFEKSLIEKQRIFKEKCMNDENFKELTEKEQTELYTKLISIM